MAGKQTFTTETRTEARRLYDEGNGCNAIARLVGFSPARISKWAKEEHLAFDRSQTDLAVRAHVVDLAEARMLLAQKMTVAADDMLNRLDGEYLVYNFGGKDNDYSEHLLADPPVEVVRNAVTTAGIAFDKATKVVEWQADPGEQGAKAMLSSLGEHLGIK